MKQRFSVLITWLAGAFLLLMATATTSFSAFSGSDDLTVQEIIAKHVDSIGTAEARAAVKSRVIFGTAVVTFRIGGTGHTRRADDRDPRTNQQFPTQCHGNRIQANPGKRRLAWR